MNSVPPQHHARTQTGRRTIISAWCLPCMLLFSLMAAAFGQNADQLATLHNSFVQPPDDSRIMMRWWWFGPAVTKPELQRELEQMKAAGIGGVEIATLYAQALDDPSTGFRNLSYLSDEHIDDLRFVAEEARRLGLRVDITLGSGWPFGGPAIPVTQAAGELRVESVAIPAGATSVAVPYIDTGERFANRLPRAGLRHRHEAAGSRASLRHPRRALVHSQEFASAGNRSLFYLQPHRDGRQAPCCGRGGIRARSLRSARDRDPSPRGG